MITEAPELGQVVRGLDRIRSGVGRLRRESLLKNSFFLLGTTALNSGSGFAFWLIVARLFAPEEVGRATTLLSAVALLSYFALMGLNSTLVRRLPTTSNRSELVCAALGLVGLASLVICTGYAVLTPWTSPELSFIATSPFALGIFVLLAVGAALNLLTDYVFVALRRAKYNLLINGGLMSLLKLGLPWLLIGGGSLAIFVANGVASAVAALVSVVCIVKMLGHPRSASLTILRGSTAYSVSNYLSSCLNLGPQLVIPLLVLNRFGPVTAAGYFVAFQIATLLNSISFAVGEALFAEGSHRPEQLADLGRRSAQVMALALVVPVLLVVTTARWILTLFGPSYVETATGVLAVLALSSFTVALNCWTTFLLKVTAQLKAMVLANLALAATIIGGAVSARGAVDVAVAWGAGHAFSGIVALLALLQWRRQHAASAFSGGVEKEKR
jgi:O-antigen/teichoic acid export membrane protein